MSCFEVLVTVLDPRSTDRRPSTSGHDTPPAVAGPSSPPLSRRDRAAAFLALTKPRIIELLLVTTVPTMVLAAHGLPSLWLVLATLIGGSLAAGSANALNCYIDRDIDRVMHRTGNRPLVTGAVTPDEAVAFGAVLGALSVVWLALTVNGLSALLALLANVFYVGVYTLGLKRRTASNIVWGGAAGCMPVLIGWSAVTGRVEWPALVLFGVIFFWTPPHYWPLSLRFRDDYATAGVPMLPVVSSPRVVARKIVVYSWVMVACSLLLWPVAHTSVVYPVLAAVVGGVFLVEAHRLQRRARQADLVGEASALARIRPMRLFHWSITYLTLLFLAVAIDPLLPLSSWPF
ncbi:MAG: heme o synthase [Actinomycetes bacterium]